MPRLFPSFGRSKDRAREREDHSRHSDNASASYSSHDQQASAWSRGVPGRFDNGSRWQEDLSYVEYPGSYRGPQQEHYSTRRSNRPIERDYATGRGTMRSYDGLTESTVTAEDEEYGDSRYYGRDNAIPIVQRENSLNRLQEVFSDHPSSSGTGPRPVTEVSLPQSASPMASPLEGHDPPPPPPPPMTPTGGPPEIRNMYAQQTPILVQNSAVSSDQAEPEMRRTYSSHGHSPSQRSRRSATRPPGRPDMRRETSSSGRSLDDEIDYPPVVVVVERGRNGKPDTYYVIPGGAPVIFEDERGNELTRVGDFTGRHKPKLQRPVIIEDEHGREVGRLGFGDEGSLDYPNRDRSDDGSYRRGYDYQGRYADPYTAAPRSAPSYGSRSREREYRDMNVDPRRGGKPFPNVVYIPYPEQQSQRAGRYAGQWGSPVRPDYASTSSKRSYQSSNVIHLDDFARYGRENRSESSGSSGRRSYGSRDRR